jgi:beta-glucosidase
MSTRALKTFQPFKFLHPIVYGEYPKSIQRTVKDIDYVGVNQYIVYYVPDWQPNATARLSYSSDWHIEFVCKSA